MKRNSIFNISLLIVGLSGLAQTASAAAINEITNVADLNKVSSGEEVVYFDPVLNSKWPMVRIYKWIPGVTPEEAAAIFFDYRQEVHYVPGIERAEPAFVDKRTADVEYKISILGISSENYTVRDVLSTYDGGSSYQVAWNLVRADSTKDAKGSIRFEPLAEGSPTTNGTLVAYENFIEPGDWVYKYSWFIDIYGEGKKNIKATAAAILKHIQNEGTQNPELLKEEVQTLRNALSP